jgi:hypothetical protein
MSIEKIFSLVNFILLNVCFSALFVYYFYYWYKKGNLGRLVKIGFIYYAAFVVGINSWRAYLLYISYKSSPLGKYFLPPQSNYYYEMIWRDLSFYIYSLLAGLILYLIINILLKKFLKFSKANDDELKLLVSGAVLAGWTNLISYFAVIVILMLITLIFINLFKKGRGQSLPLMPFIFLAVIIILLVGYNSCAIFKFCSL